MLIRHRERTLLPPAEKPTELQYDICCGFDLLRCSRVEGEVIKVLNRVVFAALIG